MLTQARLKELLRYDQETGIFTRLVRTASWVKVGDTAGCQHNCGYLKIGVSGKEYLAHRLAWLYMTGRWPSEEIDHRNGMREDNRWLNLREATTSENAQNLAVRSNNKSGLTGVIWYARYKKWQAQIQSRGQQTYLGRFEDKHAAYAAYLAAKAQLHTFNPTVREGA